MKAQDVLTLMVLSLILKETIYFLTVRAGVF